jgi:putative protease
MYRMKSEKHRYFSCLDFSADVLAKVLKEIPQVAFWKIEGRKKSPHYVFYTVKAFQLLRDHPSEKKQALVYLDHAMGRPFTHYNLLSHRTQNPLDHQDDTGSGLFLGRTNNPAVPFFNTREALFPQDLLRIGNEEDTGHKVKRGTPVHLIDRRTDELTGHLEELEAELTGMERTLVRPVPAAAVNPDIKPSQTHRSSRMRDRIIDIRVSRRLQGARNKTEASGIWISGSRYSTRPDKSTWLWLDPSIFPEEEPVRPPGPIEPVGRTFLQHHQHPGRPGA